MSLAGGRSEELESRLEGRLLVDTGSRSRSALGALRLDRADQAEQGRVCISEAGERGGDVACAEVGGEKMRVFTSPCDF